MPKSMPMRMVKGLSGAAEGGQARSILNDWVTLLAKLQNLSWLDISNTYVNEAPLLS